MTFAPNVPTCNVWSYKSDLFSLEAYSIRSMEQMYLISEGIV